MTLLGLLRHGDVQGGPCFRGSTDDPLTQEGWQQMWQATEQNYDWDQVVTSPLHRCRAFADEYAMRQGLSVSVEERLAEIDFGDWEGRTAAELMATQHDALTRFWNNPLRHTPPNAEPLIDFSARVMAAWNDLIRLWPDNRILVVTHGGVIRVVLCHLQNCSIDKLLDIEVGHGDLFLVYIPEDHPGTVIEVIKHR